jgi:hypothetical protein
VTPLGRLIEGALVAARFAWFYSRAPGDLNRPGFGPSARPTPLARARWAWDRTNGWSP